ncbi:MAG: acyl-CoA dehydrogenase family protein [Streptosporangiales bacterium]
MELDLGPEMLDFRTEIRSWITDNAPPELSGLADWYAPPMGGSNRSNAAAAMTNPAYTDWESRLVGAHLICPQWPESVGGKGWNSVHMAVWGEECHRAGVPRVLRGMGEWLVGPAVTVHGTDEQRARLLPRIISGEDRYCQGFSEPEHGSDLAGVETRGTVDGDQVILTGQKVWTSGAQQANMIFVLCRTDPGAPKHQGLSYVLVPMEDNNIEIRPLGQMSGATEFFEDFLDGACAPLFNVIGGLGNGWRVAMTTLGFERGGRTTMQHVPYEREFWELVDAARKHGRDDDPRVRQQLAWAYTHVQLMRFQGLRVMASLAEGQQPGPEASVNKLFWSEYHRRLGEIAVSIIGTDALVRPDGEGYATDRWQDVLLSSRGGTIYSGTSEIQRNIVAERVLGLPREPRSNETRRS